MTVASLVDTNVLIYRCDPRFPGKMERATEILRKGAEDRSLLIPHQALVEFVAATTRSRGSDGPILRLAQALPIVEEFMESYEVLMPNEAVVRTAFTGVSVHGIHWYDAHLWAYAVEFEVPEILTEDLPVGPRCGVVRYVNPFVGLD